MPASALKTRARRAAAKPEAKTAPPSARERVEWDAEVAGLGLRRRGDAPPRWIVQARAGGRTVKRTLGLAASMTLDEARAAARVALGELTGAAFAPEPAAEPWRDATATVAEFAARYLADCAGRWKPLTRARHARNVAHTITPTLGDVRLADLTRQGVAAWRAALPGAASSGNRALAVLSGLCRHAELVGERPPGSNPCAGMRRRKSGFTARYLSDREWGRLGRALRELEPRRPELAALIRFIALTGCRAGEARVLQWDWIEGGRAALPDSKSGPKTIWLGAAVRSLLAERPQTCPWVFARRELPIGEGTLWNAWVAVRAHARLDDVRLHDLRHSFASVAISSGETLRVVAGLLGHTELTTTEGYAHLAEAPVRAAAERMGAFLDRTLGKRRPGSVAVAPAGRRAAALVALYRTSKLSLRAFCAEHDLDARAFHTMLVEAMAAKRRARS